MAQQVDVTGAVRARRYRQRMRAGTMVCQVETTRDIRDALVGLGILDPDDSNDRAAVADSVEILLYAAGAGAIDINPDALD